MKKKQQIRQFLPEERGKEMTIKGLQDLIKGRYLWEGFDQEQSIKSVYVSDLLSLVMANGQPGMAWITVQNHLNVVAVAALMELSCVVLVEDVELEESALEKAKEKNIPIISTNLSAYTVSGLMNEQKIKGSR